MAMETNRKLIIVERSKAFGGVRKLVARDLQDGAMQRTVYEQMFIAEEKPGRSKSSSAMDMHLSEIN